MSFIDRLKRAKENITSLTELVSAEVAEERMSICKECPMLTTLNRCKECGCFMDAKTKIKGAACPLQKW